MIHNSFAIDSKKCKKKKKKKKRLYRSCTDTNLLSLLSVFSRKKGYKPCLAKKETITFTIYNLAANSIKLRKERQFRKWNCCILILTLISNEALKKLILARKKKLLASNKLPGRIECRKKWEMLLRKEKHPAYFTTQFNFKRNWRGNVAFKRLQFRKSRKHAHLPRRKTNILLLSVD